MLTWFEESAWENLIGGKAWIQLGTPRNLPLSTDSDITSLANHLPVRIRPP
jgi:hypothetical protein